MKGYDIKVNSADAASNVINHLGVGIPKALTLRELVINGIEACQRNKDEAGSGVYIKKDHDYYNKLSVVNVGGDFLSQENIENHLATLGSTGNTSLDGQQVLDANKGIGAKVAYLPQAIHGLLYRSIKKGEGHGITVTMCQDTTRNVYTLPAKFCEWNDTNTSFQACFSFDERMWIDDSEEFPIAEYTGTEVVCMGNTEDEDTWLEFDRLCGIRKGVGDGGTGYGIFKYLTHRLWSEPPVPVRSVIYDKASGDRRSPQLVKGLKSYIRTKTKVNGVIPVKVAGFEVQAYWGVVKGPADEGYVSNWASSGLTSFAWKGETYFDFDQSAYSKKKDVKECGIVVKPDKVMIVFEFADDIELSTNAGRTLLYYNNQTIDKAEFHEAFRKEIPQQLVTWQEENQQKSPDDKDLFSNLQKLFKKKFKMRVVPMGTSPLKCKTPTIAKAPSSSKVSKNKARSAMAGRQSSSAKLKQMICPELKFIADEDEEALCEFHYKAYQLVFNTAHPLYVERHDNLVKKFGSACLIKEDVEYFMKFYMLENIFNSICEIDLIFASSLETKKEHWSPLCLQRAWTIRDEQAIYEKLKNRQKDAETLAA